MRLFSFLFLILLLTFLQGKPVVFQETDVLQDSLSVADSSAVSDSITVKDSLSAEDSLAEKKPEKFVPLKLNLRKSGDSGFSEKLDETSFGFDDYRFAGNLFTYVPFGFLQDPGIPGLPAEVQVYGFGFNSVTYLENGISSNNRLNNSFNLNYLSSENISAIEMVPLPRGFLYGNVSNPVTINIVPENKYFPQPYTKLRILLGPDEEAQVDVYYSRYLARKLPVHLEINHSSFNSPAALNANNGYSAWQIKTGGEYYLSEKFTLSANYGYLFSRSGLSGGVDPVTTFESSIARPDIFDYQNSLTVFENRYSKNLQHNLNFSLDGEIIKNSPTRISFYRYFNLDQFRQNEISSGDVDPDFPVILRDQKYTVTGNSINQKFNAGFAAIEAEAGFEQIDYEGKIFNGKQSGRSVYALGKISGFAKDSFFIPSIYAKTVKDDNSYYNSFGTDVTFNLGKKISIYAGVSKAEQPFSPVEKLVTDAYSGAKTKKMLSGETGIKITTGMFSGSASVFGIDQENFIFPSASLIYDSVSVFSEKFYDLRNLKRYGANLNFNLLFWKISAAFNGSYYFYENKNTARDIPEYTLFSGLYYKNFLFNDNLELKAGVNFYAFGQQDYKTYDYENILPVLPFVSSGDQAPIFSSYNTQASYQLDLLISGRIQDRATITFVWENLTGNKYYIVPLFPKQSRGIKINISWEMYN